MRSRTAKQQEARLADLIAIGRTRKLDLGEGAEMEELVERKRDRDVHHRHRLPRQIEQTRAKLARLVERARQQGLAIDREAANG